MKLRLYAIVIQNLGTVTNSDRVKSAEGSYSALMNLSNVHSPRDTSLTGL